MIPANTFPSDVRKIDDSFLITWSDDHRTLLPNKSLRWLCPCAHCLDEWTQERTINIDSIPESIEILQVEPVGRYGLKISWSDHHSTGIYSFQYLRSICPCEQCRPNSLNEGKLS